MSKNTNDGLTRSGTGCFTAVLMWQQWATKVHAVKEFRRFNRFDTKQTDVWQTDRQTNCVDSIFVRCFFVCFNYSCHSVRMSCWIKRLLTYLLTYLFTPLAFTLCFITRDMCTYWL